MDPLGVYEATFSQVGDQPEAWRRVADKVALRFPDPEGRRDAAGRVIPHDFVLLGPWADGINSLEDGRQRLWHEIADEFESVWDKTEPPSAPGVTSAATTLPGETPYRSSAAGRVAPSSMCRWAAGMNKPSLRAIRHRARGG